MSIHTTADDALSNLLKIFSDRDAIVPKDQCLQSLIDLHHYLSVTAQDSCQRSLVLCCNDVQHFIRVCHSYKDASVDTRVYECITLIMNITNTEIGAVLFNVRTTKYIPVHMLDIFLVMLDKLSRPYYHRVLPRCDYMSSLASFVCNPSTAIEVKIRCASILQAYSEVPHARTKYAREYYCMRNIVSDLHDIILRSPENAAKLKKLVSYLNQMSYIVPTKPTISAPRKKQRRTCM